MPFLCLSEDIFDSLGQTLAIHWFRPIDQGDSVVNLRAIYQLQSHNPRVTGPSLLVKAGSAMGSDQVAHGVQD